MVELHRTGRERTATVNTRKLTNAIEHLHLLIATLMPLRSATLRVAAFLQHARYFPPGVDEKTACELRCRPYAMAIPANDIALRDFSLQDHAILQKHFLRREAEQLGGRIPVIEVHDMRRKRATAVHARNAA